MINDSTARGAKPKEKRYLITDSRGLYLEVMPSDKKYWRYRCKNANGKRSWLTIGEYPEVSIKMAREKTADLRMRAARGEPLSDTPKPDMRFANIAGKWARDKTSGSISDKSKSKVRRALDIHILPAHGERDIRMIKPKDVLEVMRAVADGGHSRAAIGIKYLVSQIFRYAAANGIEVYDPCSVLKGVIPLPPVRHIPTLTDTRKIGELLRRVNEISERRIRIPMMFLICSMCRTQEVRLAEWSEVDMTAELWRIPGERMKRKVPHIVPLSRQMMEMLDAMRSISGNKRYIFPKVTNGDEDVPMAKQALGYALKKLGYADVITPHGFRSMASTLLHENGFNSDWIEKQLAHSEKDKTRAAYNHADYLPDRKRMLQWYADELDRLRGEPINLG